MISLPQMAALPMPTADQREAFVEHVCAAHSWYKHLSYAEGARFVVFLAPDAGAGFEHQARIHHTWKTTAEYRTRFGHLDYMWETEPGGEWSRDAGEVRGPAFDVRDRLIEAGGGSMVFGPIALPEAVASACSFTLHPWCSNRDGDAIWMIGEGWGDRNDGPLPSEMHGQLAALAAAYEAELRASEALPEALRALVDQVKEGTLRGQVPRAVAEYLAIERLAPELYAALRAPEVAKIRGAIEALARLIWPART